MHKFKIRELQTEQADLTAPTVLYHTGDRTIQVPDLHIGRRNADFGQGFYLSADSGFAGAWSRYRTSSDIYVNKYICDFRDLNVKIFERSSEWFEYIFNNRRGSRDQLAEYDVITGPIANDTLFDTFGIITSGLLPVEQALELLKIGPEYTQTVIKTERGLSRLKWESAHILTASEIDEAKHLYAAQSKDYEEAFAAAMEAMDI